jgi:hypothetical protein
MKMDLQEVGFGGTDWIEPAKDGDRWRGLVSAVRTIRFCKMQGIL